MTHKIAFASGKGGVGKTSLALNTATLMAKQGKKVLLFDGDFGLANVDVQLGLNPEADLASVLNKTHTLADIVQHSLEGFDVIPGHSGAENLAFISQLDQQGIMEALTQLAAAYDVLLLDVPAGLDATVLSLCAYADTTCLVVTPDPSAITDGYAVIKLLLRRLDIQNVQLLVNRATSQKEGDLTVRKIQMAAEQFLGLHVPHLGTVPDDKDYAASVKRQQLAVTSFPNGSTAQALENIITKLGNTN